MLQRLKMYWQYRIQPHNDNRFIEFLLNVIVGLLFWSVLAGFVIGMILLGPYSMIPLGVVAIVIMCWVFGWILRL